MRSKVWNFFKARQGKARQGTLIYLLQSARYFANNLKKQTIFRKRQHVRVSIRLVTIIAMFCVTMLLVGCATDWWTANPKNETSPDRRWINCMTTGANVGLIAYSPKPVHDEFWESEDGTFGTELPIPYHFYSCADIGETELSACRDGCQTFADMAASDGILDELLPGWHMFDYDQGEMRLWYHSYDGTANFIQQQIYNKCIYDTSVLHGDTKKTCTEEEADSNAIVANSLNSDTYNGKAITGSSVSISSDIGGDVSLSLYTGSIGFGFGTSRICEEDICPITIGNISGHVHDFVLENDEHQVDITDARFSLSGDVIGTYSKDSNAFTLPSNEAKFVFEFWFGAHYGNYVLTNNSPITGTIDLDAGTYSLNGIFSNADASLDMNIVGIITDVPPIVETTMPEKIECTNNYSAIYIPDGTSPPYDITKVHVWQVENDSGFVLDNERGATPTLTIPMKLPGMGERTIRHILFDDREVFNSLDVQTRVVDTTPPEIDNTPEAYVTCIPNNPTITLKVPAIKDICTSDSTLTISSFIKLMNGYDAGMAPVVNNEVVLPIGESVIVWRATDQFGNVAEAEQTVSVKFEIGPWCCDEETQTMVEGTEHSDNLIQPLTYEPWCILSYGGQDNVFLSGDTCSAEGDDFVAAGSGGDYIVPRSCDSTIVAQSGDDFVYCANDETVYGGEGQDNLSCTYYGDNNVLYGGYGSDFIYSGGGDDVIYPGPGVDYVNAGIGDDVVIVYHVCELDSGKLLNGGIGNDTLYIPVSKVEAQALGVTILGFESIILTDPMLKGLSDCALE